MLNVTWFPHKHIIGKTTHEKTFVKKEIIYFKQKVT